MSQATQNISKWLVCLAALLTPIQAMQGTPVMCHLLGHCSLAQTDGDKCETKCCCCQRANCNAARQSVCHACGCKCEQVLSNDPAKCPNNCWCKCAPLPLFPPTTYLQVQNVPTAECPVLDQIDPCAVSNEYTHRVLVARSLGTPTAQQVCAALCRFTT